MKRMWLIVLGVMALVNGSVVAQRPSAPIVRQVQIENRGYGRIDESYVLSQIMAHEGKPLESGVLSRDVKALLDTGRFSYVDVRASQDGGQVIVIFAIKNRLKLADSPTVSGHDHFRAAKIRRFGGLEIGDLVDDHSVKLAEEKIEAEYRKDYFPEVSVEGTLKVVDEAAGVATLAYVVKEGKRARLEEMLFDGNTVFTDHDLWKLVSKRHWYNPFSWWGGRRYDPDQLETGRIEIQDAYMAKGYMDCVVADAVVTPLATGGVRVTYNVTEGPVYDVGHIDIKGVTLFPEFDLRQGFKLIPGKPLSPDLLDHDTQAVRDYYGSRGYIDTVVRPHMNPEHLTNGLHRMNIVLTVEESRLVHIQDIHIRGNTRTRDKVIRRELLVYPGEVFDEVKIRTTRSRLMNLGYFDLVRYSAVKTGDAGMNDLVFDVEEKQTGQFQVGFGYSSVDSFFGYVGISQANFDLFGWPYFTGGGQKVKLYAQVGSSSRNYEVSFVEPWFLDRKLELQLDGYRRESELSDYDIKRTGATIGLGKSIGQGNRLDVKYKIERVEISNIADTNEYFKVDDPTESYYFTDELNEYTLSSVTTTLSRDRRDNPFVPTHGYKASAAVEVAGGPFGLDVDYYDLSLNYSHYFPLWFDHVLSFRFRSEVIESYGSSDLVPLADRLFIGGGKTLRGFDYRDVGPKVYRDVTDEDTGESYTYHRPIGGQTLGLAGLEYSIPIAPRVLRFAMFYDIGNVWEDPYEMNFDNLAASVGAGIRIDLPGFPIRIDRAWVVEKDNDLTDEDSWVFWIGQSY